MNSVILQLKYIIIQGIIIQHEYGIFWGNDVKYDHQEFVVKYTFLF